MLAQPGFLLMGQSSQQHFVRSERPTEHLEFIVLPTVPAMQQAVWLMIWVYYAMLCFYVQSMAMLMQSMVMLVALMCSLR